MFVEKASSFSQTMVYAGLLMTFLALAYSAFSTGSSTALFEPLRADEIDDESDGRQADDERERTSYNYSFFHIACKSKAIEFEM
jgi:hypothetical protein